MPTPNAESAAAISSGSVARSSSPIISGPRSYGVAPQPSVRLAVTFRAIATNLHLLANWHANLAAGGRIKRHRLGRPRINPRLCDIRTNPSVLEPARQKKRKARRPTRAKPPPDNPFANLAAPRS